MSAIDKMKLIPRIRDINKALIRQQILSLDTAYGVRIEPNDPEGNSLGGLQHITSDVM